MKQRNGHPLRRARSQRNLTLDQLAEAARVGASTVWRAEHGYPISAESRQRLCAYFEMTSQDLGLSGADLAETASTQHPEQPFSQLPPQTAPPTFLEHSPIVLFTSFQSDPPCPQQQTSSLVEQMSSWLALGSSQLASLFEAGWTLEAVLDAVRVVLQGVQGMPLSVRYKLLQVGGNALISHMALPSGEHLSHEERHRLGEMIDKSIAEGWHLFHTARPAQVFVVAQTLLTLVQQTHAFLPIETRPSMYAAIYNLIGASLLFQGNYALARRAHEKAHIAALEGADSWNMAQSLNWQAIVAQICGHHTEALHLIEAALRLVEQSDDEASIRLRAHLLVDWAYNAAHLQEEEAHFRTRLQASVEVIEPLGLNEEFDLLRWRQIAGCCFLLKGHYTRTVDLLEQSLLQLPPQWFARRILTLLPLAEAYARAGERDASLETAKQLIDLLLTADSTMLTFRFVEYTQVLHTIFSHDQHVHAFLSQAQHRLPVLLQTSQKAIQKAK